jgi:hypothetical protein
MSSWRTCPLQMDDRPPTTARLARLGRCFARQPLSPPHNHPPHHNHIGGGKQVDFADIGVWQRCGHANTFGVRVGTASEHDQCNKAAQSRATQRSAHAWSPNKSNKMCEQHANASFARRVWTRGGGGCTLHLLCKPINTVQARESHHRGATTPTASRPSVHVECIRWQAKKRDSALLGSQEACDPTTFLRWVGCGRERWLWVVPCRCRTRLGHRRGVSLRGMSAWRERTDARTATTASRWCVCVGPLRGPHVRTWRPEQSEETCNLFVVDFLNIAWLCLRVVTVLCPRSEDLQFVKEAVNR